MGSHCTSAQVELIALVILHNTIPPASSHYPEGKVFQYMVKGFAAGVHLPGYSSGKPLLNLDTTHWSTSLSSPLPLCAQHTTNPPSNRQVLPLSKAGGGQSLPHSHREHWGMKCACFWFYFPISEKSPFSTSDINIENNVTSEKRVSRDTDITDQIYHSSFSNIHLLQKPCRFASQA